MPSALRRSPSAAVLGVVLDALLPWTVLLWASACLPPVARGDAGTPRHDAGAPPPDAGASDEDDGGGEDGGTDGGADVDAALPVLSLPHAFEVALDPIAARTEPVTVTLSSGDTLLVRVDAAETPAGACFTLEDVVVDGETWVPLASEPADYGAVCARCAQRAFVQRTGSFVAPNDGTRTGALGEVSLRGAVRDCGSGFPFTAAFGDAPSTLRIEVGASESVPDEVPAHVDVAWALASSLGFGADSGEPLDEDPFFRAARDEMDALYAQVDVRLHDVAFARIDDADRPVTWSTRDLTPLEALVQASEAALPHALARRPVLVVFVPCLERHNESLGTTSHPDGVTTHIPSGLARSGDADAVFVSVERCQDVSPGPRHEDPIALARVVAHELGHALGLHHAESDHLDDTSSGEAGRDNLMRGPPPLTGPASLTPMQGTVIRHSPLAHADPHLN